MTEKEAVKEAEREKQFVDPLFEKNALPKIKE